MSFKKIILLGVFSALLTACGTKVSLTESANVEDRPPQSSGGGTTATPGSGSNLGSGSNPGSGSNLGQGDPGKRDVNPVKSDPVSPSLSNVILFDFDSYIVRSEGQRVLEGQAKVLSANRNAKVSLAGHTDDSGGREYNLALGQKRADAVKKALSILGVTDAQMEAVSYGKEKPVNAGTDDASRAANRRVEISAR